MEGPRPPKLTEYPQVLDFLKSELRPQHSWSLAHEYPTALSTTNLSNIRMIAEGEQVLAHAVIKPLIVRTPAAIWKVGTIGSVVTHPDHRGKGLSTLVLESCLTEIKSQDCDLAVLWTNLFDFYRKIGFELAGSEISYSINKDLACDNNGLRFLNSTKVSPELILKLYSQHSVQTVRSAEDVRKFLNIPQSSVYTAWDQHNQLVAFAVEGKGADLTNYVHEWGGAVTKLIPLLNFIRKEKKSDIKLIVPSHSVNLQLALQRQGLFGNEGFLGMIKIIRPESVLQKIKKAATAIAIHDLVLKHEIVSGQSLYTIGLGDDKVTLTDEKDFVRLIFGPLPDVSFFKTQTRAKLERLLPMNLWLWGWDSI
jgi:GNAT superfamily N-acetyltransferase